VDTLHSRLRGHAERAPSRVALAFAPTAPGAPRVELTYGELVDSTHEMARVLAASMARGDRAMIVLPPGREFAVSFLGCLEAGVIAVPMPLPADENTRRRVLAVADDCGITAVISTSFLRDLAAADEDLRRLCTDHEWLLVDALDTTAAARPLPALRGADVAFLQYTSGSTRTPRGVVVSHGALLANEAAIRASFGVTPDSTIVSWLPLHHDMGLIGGMLQPLYTGGRGVILDPLSFVRRPASWLETISAERADISGGPNFAYDLCVRKVSEQDRAGLDLSSWRVAFNGAAQVYPRTLRAFTAAFAGVGFRPSAHMPCYGLAEATLLVTAARADATDPVGAMTGAFAAASLAAGRARTAADGEAARELVGYPLPAHATVRIADPATLAPVDEGTTGEILVSGPSNGSGYWGDPGGATFGVTLPGEPGPFVRTGDLGFVHRRRLHVEGRHKDLIVQRGRNVHPEDLEADVSVCHESVRPGCGAVFGVEHDGDEAVVVCQEVRPGTPPERHAEIAARIRTTLARAHGVTVRTVVLVPPRTVTKTSSGKVQRHAARRRFLAGELPALHTDTPVRTGRRGPDLATRFAALPADRAARAGACVDVLRDHLREVLDLPERPAAEDSLAALGADSLTATQLRHELEQALGIELGPTATLRAESIAELAAIATAAAPSAPPSVRPEPAPAAHGVELNAAQRALWFLHRAFPGSADYNVTRAFRLTGDVDTTALSAAFDAVTRRHPSLRLAVVTSGGEPRAVLRDRDGVSVETLDATTWSPADERAWYRDFATRPFDLEHDPLLRTAVLRRADDWLLVMSLHHIVCDVSSLAVIVADLAAACGGGLPAVPADTSPAELERAVLAGRGEDLRAFWQAELAGELPALSLPVADPAEPAGPGEALSFEVEAATTAALGRFARASGLTLHNVLLAAYQVLLHRVTGQRDLVVGVPTAGRADRRLASWVGYLVNVLPVRSVFAPADGFEAFARRTQARVLDVMDHQELPLSHITRLVNPDRTTAAGTIFQAMFSYYTTALPGGADAAAAVMGDPDAAVPLGGAVLHGHPLPDHTAQSDIGLNVAVRRDRLRFDVQYDRKKVTEGQARTLASAFRTLLTALADGPDTAVRALALLTPAEIAARVAVATGPEVRRPGNYLDSFEQVADRTPDRVAVDDGAVRLTYAELDERANHVAERLRAAGVGVDACVVVCADRSVDYLVTLLGIHKADGCYVPISPREAPRRAAAMVAAVAPAAAVASEAGSALLTAATRQAGGAAPLDMAELAAGRSATRPARVCPDHGASTIIHTSGSTGLPKAAVSTHYGVTNHMWQLAEHFGLGADDCVAQTAPVSFDISVWQLLTPLMLGGRVRIMPDPVAQSPARLLRAVVDGGVTMLELVPANIVALLDAGLPAEPGALRVMLSTGETLTHDVLRRWVRELPHVPVHNAYGPAECTDDVTAGLCGSGEAGPVTVSVGRPLANTTVHVLDAELVPVPPGVVGTLHVGGGAVGRGYRGNPRRTAQVFVPDPYSPVPGGRLYRTGDLGRVSAAGDVDFLGRADTQIKIRGQRIEAGEVEAALRECAGVGEAAVKVHRGATGAMLVGYLGAARESPGEPEVLGIDEDERLRGALAELLPRHMIPTVLVRVPRLPRSKNGKVDYPALDFAAPGTAGDAGTDRTDDPLAATVRAIWAGLLDRDTVSLDDSFFALGGHSLVALTMIDRVAQTLDVDLEVDAVFRNPRLRDFVAAVRQADPATPARAVHPAPAGPVPASAAQQRFWFLREMDPDRPTYNMPGVLRFHGVLDEAALEAALRAVLDRHRVLLARFATDGAALTWTPRPVEDFTLSRLDLRGAVAEFGTEVFDRVLAQEANRVGDPRRELPFRALLARLGPKDWGLFVTIDHIVCDGWSLTVFLTDLADAYNQRVRGGDGPAPRREYGFADYCHDEQAWWAAQDRSAIAARWRDAVTGPVARSPLPARSGPPVPPGAGRISRWLDDDLATAVRELAGRTGTTSYLVFATALAALVHSGGPARETVLLGALIAQRDRPEWRGIVGPLLNVSVLAVDVAITDTVTDALRRTRDAALRAYRSAHVPFQELVALLPASPGGDGSPFDVVLVMQPPGRPAEFDGLTTDIVDVDTAAAPYPLTVDVEERDGRYLVSYRYATDRYDHADVEALTVRLPAALRALVAAGDHALERLRDPDPVPVGDVERS